MQEIELTKGTIKALSSDTRIDILKSLRERRKTVSEISNEFNLSKSTVHEHLGKLLSEELIEKNESYTNKWVYYELTKKGSEIVNGTGKKVLLLLSSVVLAVLGGISFLLSSMGTISMSSRQAANESVEMVLVGAEEKAAGAMADAAPSAAEALSEAVPAPGIDLFFILGIVLFAMALALIFVWWKKKN